MLNDAGPSVLALHGFTGAGRSWDAVRSRLPASWHVSAPDLPGHGGAVLTDTVSTDEATDGTRDLPASFEACVDRLAAWIRGRSGPHRSEPVHVVGYSLGARLALGLVVEHPELVCTATLIGVRPGLSGAAREERARRDDELADELLRDGLEAFVGRWQDLPLFASQKAQSAETLERQRSLRLGHDPRGLAWALRTLGPGRMPDYRPRLASVMRPVCLMVGELDERFRKIGRATKAAFTNESETKKASRPGRATVEVEIVPGAGHNIPLEDPAAVATALVRTVRRFRPKEQTP